MRLSQPPTPWPECGIMRVGARPVEGATRELFEFDVEFQASRWDFAPTRYSPPPAVTCSNEAAVNESSRTLQLLGLLLSRWRL